jgi:hypothetical protein
VTCETEKVGSWEPEGNNIATRRMPSTAVSGCRPDTAAGTHQAHLARPRSGWARKVRAAMLLHIGQHRRYSPSRSRTTTTILGGSLL